MNIAVSFQPEAEVVARFGHDFPVVLFELQDRTVISTKTIPQQPGCCGTLAKRIKDASVLLCTGLGNGAARHLNELGVKVAIVPEGVAVAAALSALLSENLEGSVFTADAQTENTPHGRCGCHHSSEDNHSKEHACGCGHQHETHD